MTVASVPRKRHCEAAKCDTIRRTAAVVTLTREVAAAHEDPLHARDVDDGALGLARIFDHFRHRVLGRKEL